MDLTSPHLIHAAKLLAVPLSFALTGFSLAFSTIAVPALYDLPASASAPTLVHIFRQGGTLVVPSTLLLTTTATYLSYIIPRQRRLWAFVAVAAVLPLPWTTAVMLPSNISRLVEISEGGKAAQDRATANLEARQLLKKWVWQNYVRGGLVLAAGVAAVQATLNA